jgi:hypothetical protein
MTLLRLTACLLFAVATCPGADAQDAQKITVKGHTRADLTLPGLAFIKPALGSFDAYPIGNGTLATMVSGEVESAIYPLRSDRLWEPWLQSDGTWTRPEPVAANLQLDFNYREGTDFVQEYTRALNFANGIAQTTFQTPPAGEIDLGNLASLYGPEHFHTVFASAAADVLVLHFKSDEPFGFKLNLTPATGHETPFDVVFPNLTQIGVNGVLPSREAGVEPGINYQILCSVVPSDGSMQMSPGAISISDSTETTILIAIDSDLDDEALGSTHTQRNEQRIQAALGVLETSNVAGLVEAHRAVWEPIFNRAFLRVGPTEYETGETMKLLERYPTTSSRLEGARNGDKDTYMPEMLFYTGRYLQMCAALGAAKPGNLPAYFGSLPESITDSSTADPAATGTIWSAGKTSLGELPAPPGSGSDTHQSAGIEAALTKIDPTVPETMRDVPPAIAMGHLVRAGNGEAALGQLERFLASVDLQPNLISQARPLGIDANLAMTAAISEMLLRTQDGITQLFPALPAEWSEGQFDGLSTPGGIEVAAAWTAGELRLCMMRATKTGTCKLRMDKRPAVIVRDPKTNPGAMDFETAKLRGLDIKYKDGVASWLVIKGTTYVVIPDPTGL